MKMVSVTAKKAMTTLTINSSDDSESHNVSNLGTGLAWHSGQQVVQYLPPNEWLRPGFTCFG